MRKLILTALLGASLVSSALAESLVVGATPIPHAEILEVVKDDLKAKGENVEKIKEEENKDALETKIKNKNALFYAPSRLQK